MNVNFNVVERVHPFHPSVTVTVFGQPDLGSGGEREIAIVFSQAENPEERLAVIHDEVTRLVLRERASERGDRVLDGGTLGPGMVVVIDV